MPQSVYITTPIEPFDASIKHLRVPKARQKELLTILDKAWAHYATEEEAVRVQQEMTALIEAAERKLELSRQVETGKKHKSASAA